MTREEVHQKAIAFMNDPEKNRVHNRSKSCSEYMTDFAIEYAANHLPDVSKLMYVLDTIDSQREEAAYNFVAVNDGNIRNHWDFKQGAKWAIEAIKLGVADHLPDAGNKVEPSGDSGELEAFIAGWKTCESYFDPHSEIGGAPLQMEADYYQWKSTRDNSRRKEATND